MIVHSFCVESFKGRLQRCRRGRGCSEKKIQFFLNTLYFCCSILEIFDCAICFIFIAGEHWVRYKSISGRLAVRHLRGFKTGAAPNKFFCLFRGFESYHTCRLSVKFPMTLSCQSVGCLVHWSVGLSKFTKRAGSYTSMLLSGHVFKRVEEFWLRM